MPPVPEVGIGNRLAGREAVLAAAGDDVYTRMMTAGAPVGYATDQAVGWFADLGDQPVLCMRGVSTAAADLLAELHHAGLVAPGTWIRFPRSHPQVALPVPVRHVENWKFLTIDSPPRSHPLEDSALRLSDELTPEIRQLLADGPPKHRRPRIDRQWFGVRLDSRLVACAADRSWGGVGQLGGVTVAREYRTRGLASGLSTGITRRLQEEFGSVALGVTEGNSMGMRVYQRLGYRPLCAIATYEVLA